MIPSIITISKPCLPIIESITKGIDNINSIPNITNITTLYIFSSIITLILPQFSSYQLHLIPLRIYVVPFLPSISLVNLYIYLKYTLHVLPNLLFLSLNILSINTPFYVPAALIQLDSLYNKFFLHPIFHLLSVKNLIDLNPYPI